ncbi:MAG: D-alanyl-D-alanine carboxypeptidase/D-alanyl-D-alanine endopeptidase [Rhabdochlamydiaceae bacterium]
MKYVLFLLVPLILWGDLDFVLDHASISAYAIDCRSGKVILNLEGDKSLIPASCMKVVTTGAALHLLGPEGHFQTDLEITGDIKEGVLQGDIIIRGGGDPCLGSDRSLASLAWEKQIEVWVCAILEKGIKEIRGEIVGDDTRWHRAQAPASWAWEDLGNYYGVGASALSFHENMTTVTFKPGSREGAPATLLHVIPAASNFIMRNEVTTGPVGSGDRACIYGAEYSTTQYVRGTVPAGVEEFFIKGAIPDPAKLCSELLMQALQKKGIKVHGNSFTKGQKKQVIHTTLSPKINEIIYWTNQKSINLYAEHLIKSMGSGTTANGTQAVIDFWKKQGIEIEGLNMVDGSGLSRKNFITAKQLVEILVKMKHSSYFSEFYTSLPEEKPGVRAKTGSMSFIRCITGYKGDIAFAILINNGQNGQEMEQKVDQFLTQLP